MSSNGPKACAVLVVDDDAGICRLVETILEKDGHEVFFAHSLADARDLFARAQFALCVLDRSLPDGLGPELIGLATDHDCACMVMTGADEIELGVQALEAGAYAYIFKPFHTNDFRLQTQNVLRRRELERTHKRAQATLTEQVALATEQIRRTREEIVLRLMAAAQFRDNETGAHVRRIGQYSARMATLLGWSKEETDNIRLAAPMHDVGKIGIPDAVLLKPGALTPEEWVIMRSHSTIGGDLLRGSGIPSLDIASRIAAGHHEKVDGSGYPLGLKGNDIPIEARIVAIVDVYDALTHARCYKPAWEESRALETMIASSGTHFDAELLSLFVNDLSAMREIRLSIPDEQGVPLHAAAPKI